MTLGSDIYYKINKGAILDLVEGGGPQPTYVRMAGTLAWDRSWGDSVLTVNDWGPGAAQGIFTFEMKGGSASTSPGTIPQVEGCYRDPSWSRVLQPLTLPALVPLVPIFVFCASLSNHQWLWDKQLIVMTLFGTLAFWASRLCKIYLDIDSPNYTALIGSFTIGILGNGYARITGGTGWNIMLGGISLLIPVRCHCLHECLRDLSLMTGWTCNCRRLVWGLWHVRQDQPRRIHTEFAIGAQA